MKTSKFLFLALASCMSMAFLVAGCAKDEVDTTGTIYGIVNDADSGEPVSGAHVMLNPGGKTANTGSDGRYEFLDMEPGQYTIQISKSGYKTNTKRISVVAGEEASGDMMLERGKARIKLSVSSLTFAEGETSKTFDVMNVGTSGSISWMVTGIDSWLSVAPTSGTTGEGKSSTVVVNVDRSKISSPEDVSTNLIVEADGESMPLAVSVKHAEEGGGDTPENPDNPSGNKGSCKEIISCDSEVKVEFLSCVKNADTVEFMFKLTNNREDWRVWFERDHSDALDDKGNSYPGYYIKVYVGDSNSFVTGGTVVSFLKGASIKCRVVIPNIKDEAAFLQRWDWIISSSQPWNAQTKKVTFKEVKW